MSSLFTQGFIIFVTGVALHICLVRISNRTHFIMKSYMVLIFMMIVSGLFLITAGLLNLLVVYMFLILLWNLYLIFLINLMNSVSLRIMCEMWRSEAGRLSLNEIERIYSSDQLLEDRLNDMEKGGLVRLEGSIVHLTEKGQLLAKGLAHIRKAASVDFFG